ncbi:hypothetical protein GZH53_15155 [Flavihumibacter sp. R14]|nr:hypothetical protein [Flavihumibacter soli]
MNYLKGKALVAISSLFFLSSCQKGPDSLSPDTQKVRVYFVSTFSGTDLKGNQDGPVSQATYYSPFGIVASENGTIFLTDNVNENIRKIDPDGSVTSLIPMRSLRGPSAVKIAPDSSLLVCETLNHQVVRVSKDGVITELAAYEKDKQGNLKKAKFNSPNGIAIAPDGSIYIADTFNNKIRKVNASGLTTVFAGSSPGYQDGPCTEAKFYFPFGLVLDKDGSLYVADYGNNMIRKITADGIVSTVAGNITPGAEDAVLGTDARFRSPTDMAIGEDGTIYISDYYNSRIRAILTTGEVTTIAGTDNGFLDGVGITAKFYNPVFLAIYKNTLYITDSNNSRIRSIILD